MNFQCRGTCQIIAPGLFLMTVEVNGCQSRTLSTTGSCHEAAYMAQAIALRIAKRLGLKRTVIWNTNRHVVHQLRGEWDARRPVMQRARDACRALSAGLDVQHRIA